MPLKNSNIPDYKVWAVDNIVYGPVDFQTLEAWVEDERVNEDTWIYRMSTDSWTKADSYPEFEKYFQLVEEEEAEANRNKNHIEINHRNLRRIKLLSLFDDTQLEELSLYLEYKRVDPYTLIVRRLTPSDSMYFILEGEVRVRINVNGKETVLATLGNGDYFGEHCMFDSSPRTADVFSNIETELYCLPIAKFLKIKAQKPALAAALLHALGKALVVKLRNENKKIESMMQVWKSFHNKG